MRIHAVVAAVALISTLAVGSVVQQQVAGRLADTTEDGDAKGKFKIRVKTRGENDPREKFKVGAKGLDATEDADGNRPDYSVWMVDTDGGEADFGDVRLSGSGKARLRWHSSFEDFPTDVTSLKDFGGGTFEIRDRDDNVLLDGEIPEFVDLADENEDGSRSRARGKAKKKLRPVDGGNGVGVVKIRRSNAPSGDRERLSVVLVAMSNGAGPFDVVAIDGDTETDIGEITTHGALGRGSLVLDTKNDDEIPGDDLAGLAGLDVEVRDAEGNVVLEGVFPEL